MHTFFSAESQPLTDHITLLPQEGAQTGGTGRPPNGYFLRTGDRALLFDVVFGYQLDALAKLSNEVAPAALVLSHVHVIQQGDAIEQIANQYDIPVFLHPADATGQSPSYTLHDPMESDLLRDLDVDVLHFPGHTPGSIMLSWGGDVLFIADSGMGPGPRQESEPPRLVRGPGSYNWDDEQLRKNWLAFEQTPRTLLPLHGACYVDRDDAAEIMQPLTRERKTTMDE